MKKTTSTILWVGQILTGCAVFAFAFDLFLEPNGLNSGGISGLAMIIIRLFPFGTVGVVTALLNLPLFFVGGKKIGMKFFVGSLIGTFALSAFLDLFSMIPTPEVEPIIGALYGGVLGGAGLGIVFTANASTGGSDIIVRLLKSRYRNMPIGQISFLFDFVVAGLTGIVFHDVSNMLYSLIAVLATSQVIDAVVYRFDYSKVALIISKDYAAIAAAVCDNLDRGVTYLYGQGYYSQNDTKVVLAAVKKRQLAELKELVVSIDPDAFIIVQEAHQVLGDGFARYSHNSL